MAPNGQNEYRQKSENAANDAFNQPAELTSLIDKKIIVAVRAAILEKTRAAKAKDVSEEGNNYASLSANEFKLLLRQAGVPRSVVEIITQHIDVNDDGGTCSRKKNNTTLTDIKVISAFIWDLNFVCILRCCRAVNVDRFLP